MLHTAGHGRTRSWHGVQHGTRPLRPRGLTTPPPHLILTGCRKAGHYQRPAGHGECTARLSGGEDGRRSQRRSALDARDDRRAARGQMRACRGTSIRGDCSGAFALVGGVTSARTFEYHCARAGWSHEAIEGPKHSPQCEECLYPLVGGVRSRVRRQGYAQNSAQLLECHGAKKLS